MTEEFKRALIAARDVVKMGDGFVLVNARAMEEYWRMLMEEPAVHMVTPVLDRDGHHPIADHLMKGERFFWARLAKP